MTIFAENADLPPEPRRSRLSIDAGDVAFLLGAGLFTVGLAMLHAAAALLFLGALVMVVALQGGRE
ncbi:MAG: hypothetical protein H0W36_10240 [Gemmatimonadetes bacterium]|nr:hypothetical protein [Gemmatimonadota bacterium]